MMEIVSWPQRLWRGSLLVGMVVLSALLLSLCFPFVRLSYLVWLSLVPFLLAVVGQGKWRGFLLGGLWGFSFHLFALSWIGVFGVFPHVALAMEKAILPAFLGLLLGSLQLFSVGKRVFFVSCCWIIYEYLQTCGIFGMTAGMLANTQARIPVMLQINCLFGMWGLSWLIVCANCLAAEWLRLGLEKKAWLGIITALCPEPLPALPAMKFAVLSRLSLGWLGLFVCTLLFGVVRLNYPGDSSTKPLVIGLIQNCVKQGEKFREGNQETVFMGLRDASQQAVIKGAQLVIWPETSLPYRQAMDNGLLRDTIKQWANRWQAWLLVGSIEKAPDGASLNAMTLVSPRPRIVDTYYKHHLVPFGEFLPWKEYMPDLPGKDLVMNYKPGDGQRILTLKLEGEKVKVGPLICFETMCTYLPRRHVLNGAGLLVVPTNDAWFKDTSELPLHFDMAIMRAVELGRPVVQVGNTGISGSITALGQVEQETKMNEPSIVIATVRPATGLTLYARWGDYLVGLCLLACLGLAVHQKRSRS